jgi:CrcB protein
MISTHEELFSNLGRPTQQGCRNACIEDEGALMAALMPYVLVGLGGFIGANARFVVARLAGALFETRFPLGTFVINVSGSFLLGILGTIVTEKVMPSSEAMRLALGVGFLGAFTTFSTFEFETHALFEDGSWLTATTNIVASLFVGLLAVRAGIVVAKAWLT